MSNKIFKMILLGSALVTVASYKKTWIIAQKKNSIFIEIFKNYYVSYKKFVRMSGKH